MGGSDDNFDKVCLVLLMVYFVHRPLRVKSQELRWLALFHSMVGMLICDTIITVNFWTNG